MKRLFFWGVSALMSFSACKKEQNLDRFDIEIRGSGYKGTIAGGIYVGDKIIKFWKLPADDPKRLKDTLIRETIIMPECDGFNLQFENPKATRFNELQVETWTLKNGVLRHLTFNYSRRGSRFVLDERVDF